MPIPPLGLGRGRVRPPNLDHLIAVSHAKHGDRLKAFKAANPPPSTWDSRTMGLIGPIKDQSQCGSCWDFSGTFVCETANNLAKVGGGPASMVLSEQYTLDCGQNGGCGGDDNTTVLAWAKATGLPLTTAYGSYQGGTEACTWVAADTLYKITDWGFADSNGGNGVTSDADIKAAIMQYGCVGCAIAANNDFANWSGPSTSPFMGGGFGQDMIDHDIGLVGWDDTITPGTTIWILRNSWGTDVGVNGYWWIASGANLIGTEAVWAVVTPVVPPAPVPPGPTPPTPVPPTPGPTPTPSGAVTVVMSGAVAGTIAGTFTPAPAE